MRILAVDDSRLSRTALCQSIRQLGHEPIEAHDGQEAWGRFQLEYFPVVITDWIMPDLDGLELTRRVRGAPTPKYSYITVLTTLEGTNRHLEALRAGADDFMTKPVDASQLEARLHIAERILDLQQEVRQLEGFLSICSFCKKIRDTDESWVPIEKYVRQRADVAFSHGVCPKCMTLHYGDLA